MRYEARCMVILKDGSPFSWVPPGWSVFMLADVRKNFTGMAGLAVAVGMKGRGRTR